MHMMQKIELSILALLLAITEATCLPDQPVPQKLPSAEPTKPLRLRSQAAKTQVHVTEATPYNPSLHTAPLVTTSAVEPLPSPSPPPPPPPPPPPRAQSTTACPIDASQLDPCAGMVIGLGPLNPFGLLVIRTCCPPLEGLTQAEARACLCTSLAPGFSLRMDPVSGVLEACGWINPPPGPLCFI